MAILGIQLYICIHLFKIIIILKAVSRLLKFRESSSEQIARGPQVHNVHYIDYILIVWWYALKKNFIGYVNLNKSMFVGVA